MWTAIVLVVAIVLLLGLIHAEKSGQAQRILLFKTPLSILFVVAWALQSPQHPLFAWLIFVALLFCLGGDVLLAIPSDKAFLAGLVSFLLGHLVYVVAFISVARVGIEMAIGLAVLIGVALPLWRWLAPHLGEMKAAVLAYIVVISIMVCAACGLAANPDISMQARLCILAGAVLFYLSDLFVARQRFVVDAHFNRQIGLPLYYGGQYLLAFAAAWVAI